MIFKGNSPQEVLKALCSALGRNDLIAKVGVVPDDVIVREIKDLLPPSARRAAEAMLAKADRIKELKSFAERIKQESPAKFPSRVVIEAMLRGIHPQTFKTNKDLPLEEKLKLPEWELVYSLNYKEEHNEKTKNPRKRGQRI